MIHKFDGITQNICSRKTVFVLVDEAHRSTGGDLGNYLMGALPNATYIGFTGTPVDRTAHGKGTFKVFAAEDEQGYLEKYSIRESIQDETTVPLHYSLAPNELMVDRETLEREFLGLAEAEGISDFEELNKVLERAVTLKNMLKNRDRVEKVARFVAGHFMANVEPMGYKAFLVAVDREACCFYKQGLDRYLPSEYSRVVISKAGMSAKSALQEEWALLEEAVPKDLLKAEVEAWARRIGVQPTEVHVRPMTRKWSASTSGRLGFAEDLLRQPAAFRRRVIVEELLHLKVPNHGKLFKSLLKAYLSDGRTRER